MGTDGVKLKVSVEWEIESGFMVNDSMKKDREGIEGD